MANISLHHTIPPVKKRRRFDRFVDPEPTEIPDLWYELSAHESLAPDRLRGGLARARTALLSAVPSWKLPEILESLAAGRALS